MVENLATSALTGISNSGAGLKALLTSNALTGITTTAAVADIGKLLDKEKLLDDKVVDTLKTGIWKEVPLFSDAIDAGKNLYKAGAFLSNEVLDPVGEYVLNKPLTAVREVLGSVKPINTIGNKIREWTPGWLSKTLRFVG